MLQSILKDMHVDEKILDQLSPDERFTLFSAMREEQLRRYYEWSSNKSPDYDKSPVSYNKPRRCLSTKVAFQTKNDGEIDVEVIPSRTNSPIVTSVNKEFDSPLKLKDKLNTKSWMFVPSKTDVKVTDESKSHPSEYSVSVETVKTISIPPRNVSPSLPKMRQVKTNQPLLKTVDWFERNERSRLCKEFKISEGELKDSDSYVHPSIPTWFKGKMNRKRSEDLVRAVPQKRVFLIRYFGTFEGYIVTYTSKTITNVSHALFSMLQEEASGLNKHCFQRLGDETAPKFHTLTELISHYKKNPISVENDEYLGEPV